MKLARCNNVADFRAMARRKLPSPLFDFIDGGADDEVTLARNSAGFDDYELIPQYLSDVSQVDLATTVFGKPITAPFIMAPTGMTRLYHHEGERAVVRAAGRAGVAYALSTVSTVSLEEVAKLSSGPIIFQLYIHRDRELTRELIERAKAAGYDAICLTIDTAVLGNRERDLVSGLTTPPKLTLKSWFGFATRPGWAINYFRHETPTAVNISHRITTRGHEPSTVLNYVNSQFDRSVTWDDVAEAVEIWGGPFAIKGVLSANDALRSVEAGASAVIVSNHGGRQLDAVPGAITVLEEVTAALDGRAEIILDGGVRRGTDVLKALVLGARACMMGRPYLWAVASAGEAGVDRLLNLLRTELERDMALLGCTKIDDLTSEFVRRRFRVSG